VSTSAISPVAGENMNLRRKILYGYSTYCIGYLYIGWSQAAWLPSTFCLLLCTLKNRAQFLNKILCVYKTWGGGGGGIHLLVLKIGTSGVHLKKMNF
jgi:hypothetical protein